MPTPYPDATPAQVDAALAQSFEAFKQYGRKSLKERAQFLTTIAEQIEAIGEELLDTASGETHLTKERLEVELTRTLFQLRSYGEACARGAWLDIRIDTADTKRNPPKPDLRKMLVPLGPVVVFGASNFPFAYSTAGGDTACALAAGCSVILKAHPAHAKTSEGVAAAIRQAAKECSLPESIFIHLHGGFETGQALVKHPSTAAVAFTGSLEGGRALFDLANSRPHPIPVFAEMGSVNPVFLLPKKLEAESEAIATMYAASITQSVGQFCTNPGVLVGIEGKSLNRFKEALGFKISQMPPAEMLHPGIAKAFQHKRAAALDVDGVQIVGTLSCPVGRNESIPTVSEVSADIFLQNHLLQEEVFGPFSILVRCKNAAQMLDVAKAMEGQLTCSLMTTMEEAETELIEALRNRCGRLVFNGVPTGVDVALAMHHGGPYPATTDSRFTAVGADGIKRFARPVCYQGFPDALLPPELQAANPLGLWRTVDGELVR